MLLAAVMNTIIGVAFLGFFWSLGSVSSDILDDSNPIAQFLLLPVWFFLEVFSVVGLVIGVPFILSGIVCFVLVFPYLGRMREIRKARRNNGRKIPKELLLEMLQSGELDEQEYESELAKYELKKETDDGKPKPSVKDIAVKVLSVAFVGGIMVCIPVLIAKLISSMH